MTSSTEQLVTGGRVKSMKSKFESLSSLDSLDISGPLIHSKPKPFAKFQRSATSLDLFEANKSTKGVNDKHIFAGKSTNIRRQSSDTFLSKLENRSKTSKINPLNEIKENVEQVSRLTRQTSDPAKRSSIRRSPAFRVGEKPIKTVASKVSKTVPEEDVPEKIDKFLKRSVNDDKFLQPGITDTLKAALRQPLPSGPPPKKPPRAFESPKENINTIQLFEDKLQKEKESNDWKEKSDFLHNNLRLKSTNDSKTAKTHPAPSNFLSCIPCTTPIYDVVVAHTKDSTALRSNDSNSFAKTSTKSNPSEHIYMEPFSHLKEFVAKKQQYSTPDIVTNSTSLSNDGKTNSDCSCPEDHNGNGDLHYLVSFMF